MELESTSPAAAADPALSATSLARERLLADWLRAQGSVLVGYSGGVDSAYLAAIAHRELGSDRMLAVIGVSESYPREQWEAARQLADGAGFPVLELRTLEMADERYAANPVDRCYFCKSELWSRPEPVARERGFSVIVDGTNADDLGDHRPGARAARERSVRSPLAELGFTKAEIRALSHRRGLPTWARPSSPCLSSRLPYGTRVTAERLAVVERAESALRALGVNGNLRVRYHGDMARVELDPSELDTWLEPAASVRLAAAVRAAGFTRVLIDLRGFRSGSLNVLSGVVVE